MPLTMMNKLSDHTRKGESASIAMPQPYNHPNRPRTMSSCAFVRMACDCLLVVACLMATFHIPIKSPIHARAAKKSFRAKYYANNKLPRGARYFNDSSTEGPAFARIEEYANIDLELPTFPTLQKELSRSEVVVLYFGAKWCKMSVPVTKLVDEQLMSTLRKFSELPGDKQRPLTLIYVSSDRSKSQFKSINHLRSWSKVPFQSPERKLLKRYFKVCAKQEMEKLAVERQYEIPFMVVLSGASHRVVSKNGVKELQEMGSGVIDYWRSSVLSRDNGAGASVNV